MSIEEITKTVSDYQDLIKLAKAKIWTISKLDAYFYTGKGILTIDIQKDWVNVCYDDSCCGDFDRGYFEFPTAWLAMSQEDMSKAVISDREKRLKKERLENEERLSKIKTQQDELERQRYEELKAKFEK